MITTFYTIGHSTRSLDELIEMLQAASIELLIDVRSFPRSRTKPVMNSEVLV